MWGREGAAYYRWGVRGRGGGGGEEGGRGGGGGGSVLFTEKKKVVCWYTAEVYRNVQLEGKILDNKWLDRRGNGV